MTAGGRRTWIGSKLIVLIVVVALLSIEYSFRRTGYRNKTMMNDSLMVMILLNNRWHGWGKSTYMRIDHLAFIKIFASGR